MIKFFQLVMGGLEPRPASKSANGQLPTDGFRYCEPLRAATSLGWYVYLPMDLWLYWDGSETQWSLDDGENWYPLAEAIQYPGFSSEFDETVPEDCRGYAPPFLLRGADHDVLQIWTGVIAQTEPGVSLLVRGPANMTWRNDIAVLEGIIETDEWFGPLFTNVKVRKSDCPIILRRTQPFLQVQPLQKDFVKRAEKSSTIIQKGLDEVSAEDWSMFKSTVVRRIETRKRLGEYAVEVRKKSASKDRND